MNAEPGYTTTEFWGKVFVQLVALLVLFHVVHFTSDQLQGVLGLGALVIPELFYAISRGIRKAATTSPPVVVQLSAPPPLSGIKPAA
jgi:hypothetical protein